MDYICKIKGITLYGCETWRIMEADKTKLISIEMHALRILCRPTSQ